MDGFGQGLGAAQGSIELRADGALRSLDQVGKGLQNIDRQADTFGQGFARSVKSLQTNLNNLGLSLRNVGQNMTAR